MDDHESDSYSGWKALAPWRKAIYVLLALVIGLIGLGVGGAIGGLVGDVGLIIGGLAGWAFGTWLILRGMRDDIDYVTSERYAEINPGGARNWP